MADIAIITVEVVEEDDVLKLRKERHLDDDCWRTVANLGLEHFGIIETFLDTQHKPEKAILVAKRQT